MNRAAASREKSRGGRAKEGRINPCEATITTLFTMKIASPKESGLGLLRHKDCSEIG